ncbi:hypothetical protein EAF04_002771 [Stromatinia cepivora]|nr:hypothetical protein EAF04_002771 [Stromatinia cepivora]
MLFLYIFFSFVLCLVGRQDWKVFANASMISTFSPIMYTSAQAQHCMENMQFLRANIQHASKSMKYRSELVEKKLKTNRRVFKGNRQRTNQNFRHDMPNRLDVSITQRAGESIIFIALYCCYLLLIALSTTLEPVEPCQSIRHIPRHPYFRPGTGSCHRGHLFGFEWFLEWPGGQRPLNSTWPWVGVKLSILVLWGVCWMFYMRVDCWQQAQPYASRSRLQSLSCEAPRPSAFHSSPIANNYLPVDQQSGSVVKQEPYDRDPFIFGQYQDNYIQGHLQRPGDSNRPSQFDSHSHLNYTRIYKHNTVNQEIFQPIQKSNQLRYTTTRDYAQAAAPRTQQVLLTMLHTNTSDNRPDRLSKSPVLTRIRLTDTNNRTSHNLNSSHGASGLVTIVPIVPIVSVAPEVLNLQQNITSIGSPDLAEGRNEGGKKDGLLSVAGTSPHHFSAQGKHQFEAAAIQVQGYQQFHYQESNNHPQNDQAGLYERGNHLTDEYLPDLHPSPNRNNTYFPHDYPHSQGSNFFQNYDSSRLNNNMSLSYESRTFMPDTQYPMQMAHETQEQDEFKPNDEPHYPSPPPPMSENPYTAQPMTETPDHTSLELPELPKDEEEAPSPGRSKPVPKPDREITKDANGRFYCTWPGCTEETKDFNRKCEWSKHMDKHDRPYRCKETGCEKLPGFTYSGGLLRHEREVHGKHGGPKKQLNCPHPNCKRHTGKGFSRQENLNEHLRRVHTADAGMSQLTMVSMEEAEEDPNQAVITGMKRKRGNSRGDTNELENLREEIKKMKAENDELKRQSQAQQAQTAEVMRQLVELQNLATLQHPRMNAPQANM